MNERRMHKLLAVWALLIVLWPASAPAADFRIESVAGRIADGQFVVDARIEVRLNDRTIEALENGVTLEFELQAALMRPRRLWWDAEVTAVTRRFLLERHALADGYTLSEPGADQQLTFKNIDDALAALGEVRDFIAGNAAEQVPADKYRGRLRLRLDIEALPAPLRPIAYISPSWRLSSGWYEWVFVP
jgi:hypothetical protein